MKHPEKTIQQYQEDFIKNLPEAYQEEHSRLFRIGNTSLNYQRYVASLTATEDDFTSWLHTLPKPLATSFSKRGFTACKELYSFKSYCHKKRMTADTWMRLNLSKEDYQYVILQHDDLEDMA
ncbi:hypothetical protein ACG2LH_16155 [Zhouia sp. PK063]|uniref:hypothetical protein n=1 Tax=Zhouia sp. PK063 TaxID=3373602 RepID=UPI0037942220